MSTFSVTCGPPPFASIIVTCFTFELVIDYFDISATFFFLSLVTDGHLFSSLHCSRCDFDCFASLSCILKIPINTNTKFKTE